MEAATLQAVRQPHRVSYFPPHVPELVKGPLRDSELPKSLSPALPCPTGQGDRVATRADLGHSDPGHLLCLGQRKTPGSLDSVEYTFLGAGVFSQVLRK